MKKAVSLFVLVLAISGCARMFDSTDADHPQPLIRAANGKLYSGQCLQQVGFGSMADCEFDPGVAPSLARGARAAYGSGSWYDSYYNYYSSYGNYPYWNPINYNPNDFCSYYGWSSSCYQNFGYPSYYPNYYSTCSSCLYNPYSSSCYYYCTQPGYTYYPTNPTVPTTTTDACKGVAGSYSGTCISTAGTQAVSFTVSSVNGVCQFSGSYFQNATVTAIPGYGAASLSGNGVAISNTTVEVYGASQFRMTGYNYAGNFYFSCR
jgi:hypothetical protein